MATIDLVRRFLKSLSEEYTIELRQDIANGTRVFLRTTRKHPWPVSGCISEQCIYHWQWETGPDLWENVIERIELKTAESFKGWHDETCRGMNYE